MPWLQMCVYIYIYTHAYIDPHISTYSCRPLPVCIPLAFWASTVLKTSGPMPAARFDCMSQLSNRSPACNAHVLGRTLKVQCMNAVKPGSTSGIVLCFNILARLMAQLRRSRWYKPPLCCLVPFAWRWQMAGLREGFLARQGFVARFWSAYVCMSMYRNMYAYLYMYR